jgi:hypothetical protein
MILGLGAAFIFASDGLSHVGNCSPQSAFSKGRGGSRHRASRECTWVVVSDDCCKAKEKLFDLYTVISE